jgi:membrane-associated protease RseP (regulator of RpoE activity)
MDQTNLDQDVRQLVPLLADLFSIDAVYRHADQVAFSLTSRYDPARAVKVVRDRLRTAGYRFALVESSGGPVVLTVDPRRHFHIPMLNIALFLLTVLSIYLVPVIMSSGLDFDRIMQNLRAGMGLQFVAAMVSILLVHEMGHYVASRRRGIVTTWPYFIPAPNMLGTFGAVIASKSPFWNRRDLLEVGAAGPIAGWIVAVAWLAYGLPHSVLLPLSQPGVTRLGDSMIMVILQKIMLGPPPPGFDYVFNEAAFAGWAGLLVTALNMLPIGQLDGGHILYGLVQGKQKYFGWGAAIGLLGLGFQSPMWWLMGGLGILMGVAHPPTIQDDRPPSRVAAAMGIIALIILVLSFAPVPLQL